MVSFDGFFFSPPGPMANVFSSIVKEQFIAPHSEMLIFQGGPIKQRKEGMMKKAIFIGILAMLLIGCGHAAKDSEWSEHKTQYKNWDHTKFSLWGYRNPTPGDLKKSQEQGWWGSEVSIEPTED